MKGRMAIMGDADSILSFKAAGIDAFGVNAANAAATLKRLAKDYEIIFVTDNFAASLTEVIKRYDRAAYPAIIPVPSKEGGNGLGMRLLQESSERALGVDILFHKEDR